jgi:hypothetical protein
MEMRQKGVFFVIIASENNLWYDASRKKISINQPKI